jgi:hypothetical protein
LFIERNIKINTNECFFACKIYGINCFHSVENKNVVGENNFFCYIYLKFIRCT